jgi:hypothetical protein
VGGFYSSFLSKHRQPILEYLGGFSLFSVDNWAFVFACLAGREEFSSSKLFFFSGRKKNTWPGLGIDGEFLRQQSIYYLEAVVLSYKLHLPSKP